MLTVAIVSGEAETNAMLTRALQQTGFVSAVREWAVAISGRFISGDDLPDLVILDISRETAPLLEFAAHLRRLRPSIHIIACSHQQEPNPSLLLQVIRSGMQEFLALPPDVAQLRDVVARFAHEKEAAGAPAIQRLIVVAGTKGGVGTTTVAVNLGVQLAEASRKRVALLDLARPLGHASLLLNVKARFSIRDAVENLERLDAHFMTGLMVAHKSGLELLAGTSHPEEWQQLSVGALTQVINVAKSGCEHVVIDMGAQSLPEWGAMLHHARTILLVAESNVPALWSLERQFAALSAMGIERQRLRIVINRWRRDDEDALKSVERSLKHPIFLRLPNDFRQASNAVNLGVPLAGNNGSPLGSKVRELACQLTGLPLAAPERHSSLSNLFSSSR